MKQEALSAIIEAMPGPVLVINDVERIEAANAAARRLIGQQVVDRSYVAMLRQPALLEAIEACLRERTPRHAHYFSNDGAEVITFRVHVRAVEAATEIAGTPVMLTFEDITQVNAAEQMRRDFVANVSHELRTPLTALMGFIETLQGPARNDPAAQDRFLNIMQTQAERMNRLVGDLLSLSRVEETARVRPKGIINLSEGVEAVIALMRPMAQEEGAVLHYRSDHEDIQIRGDRDQITQVITNLIENAIKYGASGEEIDVDVSISERDPLLRAEGVRIVVTDKGSGIDPVHLPRLTERFYRADNHRSRELGGTGLGLAIVKHIVSRHRGRMRIDSVVGEGTKITVVLPLDVDDPFA